jgi:hypothetical protein
MNREPQPPASEPRDLSPPAFALSQMIIERENRLELEPAPLKHWRSKAAALHGAHASAVALDVFALAAKVHRLAGEAGSELARTLTMIGDQLLMQSAFAIPDPETGKTLRRWTGADEATPSAPHQDERPPAGTFKVAAVDASLRELPHPRRPKRR